jgi:hypothetical protein
MLRPSARVERDCSQRSVARHETLGLEAERDGEGGLVV